MVAQALNWVGGIDGFLELIDQRKLPGEFTKVECRNIVHIRDAIKTLAVRGAPAIGVAGAYGLVLSLQEPGIGDVSTEWLSVLAKSSEFLASSRPTAVNLFWALDRVRQRAEQLVSGRAGINLQALREAVLNEADAIYRQDVDMCRRIGQNGEKFIRQGSGILTHCNAGALATAGQGTALSVIFEAHKKGRQFRVFVDETRPLLQGARLTAWELKQAGIDVTLVCDNTAGWLMKRGKIDAVITGADRIAANGDTANKIGTYSLGILAAKHGIPFYVAAPSSTFDLGIESGQGIPIEQRAAEEVTTFGKTQIAPEGINVYNPAFDVTEASLITAIITEKGVIEKPNADNISRHLRKLANAKQGGGRLSDLAKDDNRAPQAGS
ncbi:MAG TPA: S-methyl-5-thioribose-1-phosphate isomerase [Sedimentisphaerales bacterium]|nr:S-methyl-5-thioribose-1-phosphate isomerase [Sedimentisphaerales bacterium]